MAPTLFIYLEKLLLREKTVLNIKYVTFLMCSFYTKY